MGWKRAFYLPLFAPILFLVIIWEEDPKNSKERVEVWYRGRYFLKEEGLIFCQTNQGYHFYI